MRFWRVWGQIADEIPEGSGADCLLMRFRRFRRVLVQMADEVPESFGADG